jgi:hypothetical protein
MPRFSADAREVVPPGALTRDVVFELGGIE